MQEAINNIIHFLFCTFYIYCTSCTCHKVHSKTTAGFSWDPEINYTKVPNKRLLQNPHLLFSLSTDDPGQPYPGAGHCVHQWSASCPLQVISKCSYRSKNIQVICKCLYRSKNSTLKLSIHLFERKSTVIVVLFPQLPQSCCPLYHTYFLLLDIPWQLFYNNHQRKEIYWKPNHYYFWSCAYKELYCTYLNFIWTYWH